MAGRPATRTRTGGVDVSEDRVRRTVLPSGLVLLSERVPDRRSLALGVWVRSGARDEPGELSGISHLIEHMTFKGTERRDARAIAASLEGLGGHLDAFTAREEVCYYARALEEHFKSVGMEVSYRLTSTEERTQIVAQFNVLIVFLITMQIKNHNF